MKDLGKILKQAQQMQERLAEMQARLAEKTVEASAGGGMVKIVMNGAHEIVSLKIDPTVANITLQAEALLKGDLQNIMGGLPMASGADSQTIDQQTATGVSIITTIAQRLIQARKQHYLWAYA